MRSMCDVSTDRHRLTLAPDIERVPCGAGLWQQDCSISPERERVLDALRTAVQESLTPKQREAVELFFFEGLSQGDIARRLGVTQQVVQKRIFGTQRQGKRIGGALARLRKTLNPLMTQEG